MNVEVIATKGYSKLHNWGLTTFLQFRVILRTPVFRGGCLTPLKGMQCHCQGSWIMQWRIYVTSWINETSIVMFIVVIMSSCRYTLQHRTLFYEFLSRTLIFTREIILTRILFICLNFLDESLCSLFWLWFFGLLSLMLLIEKIENKVHLRKAGGYSDWNVVF